MNESLKEPLNSANFPMHAEALAIRFPELEQILTNHGMPDFWHRPPGFQTLCLIILEQQVSLLAAERAYERITTGLGKITPSTICEAGQPGLRDLGITRQKSRYLTTLASSLISGELDLEALTRKDDEEVFEELTRLPGIGPWTANIYLMSALCRPDIWPPGDLALIKTIRSLLPDAPPELEKSGSRWKPMRGVAARLLWHWYLSQE